MSKSSGQPYVPMPDTSHPFYAGQAEAIRSALDKMRSILVPRLSRLTAAYVGPNDDKPLLPAAADPITLDVKKVVGPAPFVGDPRLYDGRYTWRAAVDPLGRHVAGPATLELFRRWIS